MSKSTFVVCHLAVFAASSALLAGCGGGDISSVELASTTPAATVRTPLVDDEGWPMPPDPVPADIARPATADRRATP